ncbi:MAG: twin-arginine translocase subunit TatC [Firmicutes bacterium]|nr:twin-arginine translocase subunit TatC [Bacillota bacterium]
MESEWTVVEHLTDLRKRLVYSLIFFVAAFAAALAFITRILHVLTLPLGHVHLAVLGPGDVIQIYFMLAGLTAFGISLPFILFQIWLFVKPALSPRESRMALSLLPFIALMFVGGVLFSYFVIFPILLHFLLTLAALQFQIVITAENYFSFLTNLTLPFGLIFEMPIALLFLTQIGVVSPAFLSKMRKNAYLIIVIAASLISPPELISHLSVATPMMALYEISILLCRVQVKRNARAEARTLAHEEDKSSGKMGA